MPPIHWDDGGGPRGGCIGPVSLFRPFIREPNLVRKFRDGYEEVASCVSCNKCFAAVALAFNDFDEDLGKVSKMSDS